jgi:hypothetical protein
VLITERINSKGNSMIGQIDTVEIREKVVALEETQVPAIS